MLKRLFCDLRLPYTIELLGPTLIKSGVETVVGPDMVFVTTAGRGASDAPEVYLPGTSLKGVVRSHAERIVRTLANSQPGVCAPYDRERNSPDQCCNSRFNWKASTPRTTIYSQACLACRLFGALGFAGRVAISDAYLTQDSKVVRELRDGVAIDRKSGGAAAGAKFEFEVAVSGKFAGTIELTNFESWQVGLLGVVLRDLESERLRIGMGASRGFGHVRASFGDVELRYPAPFDDGTFRGIERMASQGERKAYELLCGTAQAPALAAATADGLFRVRRMPWADFGRFVDFGIEEFGTVVSNDPWPGARP